MTGIRGPEDKIESARKLRRANTVVTAVSVVLSMVMGIVAITASQAGGQIIYGVCTACMVALSLSGCVRRQRINGKIRHLKDDAFQSTLGATDPAGRQKSVLKFGGVTVQGGRVSSITAGHASAAERTC